MPNKKEVDKILNRIRIIDFIGKFLNIIVQFYWVIFLIFLVLCLSIILSPYLNVWGRGSIYYTLKPFFLQIFGSKESMWVFLAFFIIPIQEIYKSIKENKNNVIGRINARKGLIEEMESNMDSIFSNNVDKPTKNYWFEQIDNDLVTFPSTRSKQEWKDFSQLYKEIVYYQDLVRAYFWGKQLDVAEYQFVLQIKFIKFLGLQSGLEDLIDKPDLNNPNHKKIGRDTLSKVYPENKNIYLDNLHSKINQLFL